MARGRESNGSRRGARAGGRAGHGRGLEVAEPVASARGSADERPAPEAVVQFPTSAAEPTLDLDQVEALAGQGLKLEEILAELGCEPPESSELGSRVEAAIRKGRALGAARIKKAQYEAALGGSVSAQSHMLKLFEEARPDDDDFEWTVERVVIGGGPDEANPAH
jgi:hypothetical protein